MTTYFTGTPPKFMTSSAEDGVVTGLHANVFTPKSVHSAGSVPPVVEY